LRLKIKKPSKNAKNVTRTNKKALLSQRWPP